MILVDTNVWSESLRPAPDDRVANWARRHASALWLSTIVVGELLSGAELMPPGRRKQALLASYDLLIGLYGERIAAFDLPAARYYGEIVATLTRTGRRPTTADAQIAAIAAARGFALATRNTKDFEGLNLTLINPWDD